jgi:hypothetical protein
MSDKVLGLANFLKLRNAKLGTAITGRRDPAANSASNQTSSIYFRKPMIVTNYVSDPRGQLEPPHPLANLNNVNRLPNQRAIIYERESGILNANYELPVANQAEIHNYGMGNYAGVEDYFTRYSENKQAMGDTFKPENIFLLAGHGSDNSALNRNHYIVEEYELKEGQYALIPGKCGIILIAKDKGIKDFFEYDRPIEVFNKNTKDNFSILETQHIGMNQVTKIYSRKNSTLKHYRPKLSDPNEEKRIKLPALYIKPFDFTVTPDNKFKPRAGRVDVTISGLLRKSEPYYFPQIVTADERATELSAFRREIRMDDVRDLNYSIKQNEEKLKPVLDIFKGALAKSVLTFDEIVDLAIIQRFVRFNDDIMTQLKTIKENPEYEEWLNTISLNNIMKLSLPISFFYHFLDTKVDKPYLIIFQVCRFVGDDFFSEEAVGRRRAQSAGKRRRKTLRRRRIKK